MESLRPKGKTIIKDIRQLSDLRKELNYTEIKDITNIFRQSKVIKGRILRSIKNLFLSMKKKRIIINQQE